MKANSVSASITTNKVEETRDFYVKHFGARVTFDCGWYVNLLETYPGRTKTTI